MLAKSNILRRKVRCVCTCFAIVSIDRDTMPKVVTEKTQGFSCCCCCFVCVCVCVHSSIDAN